MAKPPDNASILFKKGKNIDNMIVGWRNKPFPQWWVLTLSVGWGRFGPWGSSLWDSNSVRTMGFESGNCNPLFARRLVFC